MLAILNAPGLAEWILLVVVVTAWAIWRAGLLKQRKVEERGFPVLPPPNASPTDPRKEND